MGYELHRGGGSECPDLGDLPDLATAEGLSFVERTRAEWATGVNRFDGAGECFFLAVSGDQTVGMCGLNLDPYLDEPAVGRLRHLYVHPQHRRAQIGRALVAACLSGAPASFDRVRLRTTNPAADRLYRRLGFEAVEDPSATHQLRF